MSEILRVPRLGLTFNLSNVAFKIGAVNVYWYGILITLGFILGMIYIASMAKKFDVDVTKVVDIIVYSIFGGILGARAYYVIFNFDVYKNNLIDVFKIWEGGIAIYGGMIGAFLVGILMCKRQKIKVLPVTDLVVGGLFLGQTIGRWGNFVNIEAFGCNTNSLFGMTSNSIQKYLFKVKPQLNAQGIDVDPTACVHPCFLYESLWCFCGFLIILFLTKNCAYNQECKVNNENKQKFNIHPGDLTLFYFFWYGMGRFFIERLRVDSLMIGSFKISRLISLILVVVSILIFVVNKFVRFKETNTEKITVNIDSADEILKRFSDWED